MRTLYGQKWYTPMDIAKLGLIKNSKGDSSTIAGNYNFVLEMINSGQLRAKNYSTGKKLARWLVPEEAVKKYHDTITKV